MKNLCMARSQHSSPRCRTVIAAIVFASIAPVAAQHRTGTDRTPAGVEAVQSSAPLRPGDLISVEVFDTPELSVTGRLAADGTVNVPVAARIAVAEMTALEAGSAIAKRLRDDHILLQPSVTVRVLERSAPEVTVLGEVTKPGTYLLSSRQSLYDALAAAGGGTERQGPTITVTRREGENVTVDVEAFPDDAHNEFLTPLHTGDIVTVSRAPSVYVVGDVGRPGEFPLRRGVRLGTLNAVALAAGLNRTAAPSKASIVRKTADGTMTIPVNLKQIAESHATDHILRAGDVLVVPRSGVKSFIDFSLPGAASALMGSVAAALILR